jgi:hypothetical protein
VASPDARDGSLTIHQDVGVLAALLDAGQETEHRLPPGRHAWVQVARGTLEANGQRLEAGDGAAFSGEEAVRLKAGSDAELLLFDLA